MRTLAIDIGNTAVKAALFDNGRLVRFESLEVASVADALSLVEYVSDGEAPDTAGYCSVVPAVRAHVAGALSQIGISSPVVITARSRVPFEIRYTSRDTLGADRLAVVAGGWFRTRVSGRPMIVVDAGTATTVEVMDRAGAYRGGPILPGPDLMISALDRGTAQLPNVELTVPDTPVGATTTQALQAGVMYGYVDAVRGLLSRITDEIGRDAVIVATGGWGGLVAEFVPGVQAHRPYLVLEGVVELMGYEL